MDMSAQIHFTEIFSSYDFYVTVLSVAMIVTLIKHTIVRFDASALDRPLTQTLLEWSGPVIGGSLAVVPGLWDQFELPVAVFVAAPCGFIADKVYKTLLKRILPERTLMTSGHRERIRPHERPPARDDLEGL